MEQNIKLNDGELAVVVGKASIIMNVNTAFELAEKAYNLNPNNDRACLNLAVAYYYNGDKEQAENSYDNVHITREELNWLDNVFSGKVVLD